MQCAAGGPIGVLGAQLLQSRTHAVAGLQGLVAPGCLTRLRCGAAGVKERRGDNGSGTEYSGGNTARWRHTPPLPDGLRQNHTPRSFVQLEWINSRSCAKDVSQSANIQARPGGWWCPEQNTTLGFDRLATSATLLYPKERRRRSVR